MPPKSEVNKLFEEIRRQNTSSSKDDENVYIYLPAGTHLPGSDFARRGVANQSFDLSQSDSNISAITQKARDFLEEYDNKTQVEQANRILRTIEQTLKGYDNLDLPEFHIAHGDDGTLGLSWRIDDALLGIAIDPDPKASSYFLLVGKQDNAMRNYGNLFDEIDLDLLLDSLVSLLRKMQFRQRGKK